MKKIPMYTLLVYYTGGDNCWVVEHSFDKKELEQKAIHIKDILSHIGMNDVVTTHIIMKYVKGWAPLEFKVTPESTPVLIGVTTKAIRTQMLKEKIL